jgi:parallel beta-helix repeat protein
VTKTIVAVLALMLMPVSAFAVDGVVLVNHATVLAFGGYPYTITQPGSYRLSGNLTVPAGANGILIATDNVTIDLNGFAIIGSGTPAPSPVHGIVAGTDAPAQGYFNIAIRNGTIRAMAADAIHILGDNVVVEDVRARNNLASGIVVRTPGSITPNATTPPQRTLIVRHSTIQGNGSYGIKAFGGLITDNTISDNSIGISVQQGAGVVARNVVSDNIVGLEPALGVSYYGNTLFNNTVQVSGTFGGGTNTGQNLCSPAPCP